MSKKRPELNNLSMLLLNNSKKFGFKTDAEFVNEAIIYFYEKKIEEQLEIAAKYKNEHSSDYEDLSSIQGIVNA